MRLLVDTHTLVWFLSGAALIPASARQRIEDVRNDVFVSPASAYEIALKFNKGRWSEVGALAMNFESICSAAGFVSLPISILHAQKAGSLPLFHADPFDRLLAAQCLIESMPILSIDSALDGFGLHLLWL